MGRRCNRRQRERRCRRAACRRASSAVEFDDLEPPPPTGRVRFDDVAYPPAEQRRPDRRLARDVADRRIALAQADDPVVARFTACRVEDGHAFAEIDLAVATGIDDLRTEEPSLDQCETTVDELELVSRVQVLAVLRERAAELERQPQTFDDGLALSTQPNMLSVELLESCASQHRVHQSLHSSTGSLGRRAHPRATQIRVAFRGGASNGPSAPLSLGRAAMRNAQPGSRCHRTDRLGDRHRRAAAGSRPSDRRLCNSMRTMSTYPMPSAMKIVRRTNGVRAPSRDYLRS